jgi:hypothetical protein
MSSQSDFRRNSGLRNRTILPLFQFCASQLAIASLLAIAIPNRPANAFNDFLLCTAQLVRLASVSQAAAVEACSDALNPKELSRCVVTIHKITPTLTPDALVACRRVRRPVELSRCVFDIGDNTRGSQPPIVLDYCRRSLLPLRYSECVVGLSRETDLDVVRMMESCIKAEDFPRDLTPTATFVPPPPPNPTAPPAAPNPMVPVNPVTPTTPVNPSP